MSLNYAKTVIDLEIQALVKLKESLDSSLETALEQLQKQPGKIAVTGIGKAGLVARKVAATLASTGSPAFYINPVDALHGDLGVLQPGDIVLIFSNSGESREITQLLPALRRMSIPTIAVTASSRSTLASQADQTLLLGDLPEACPLGLAPTATTTAMLALGDALALALMQRKDFVEVDYALRHPAGALGRRVTPISEVMRKGDNMAVAFVNQHSVRDALFAITKARTGAAIVVNNDNIVLGIFTDGDLRRGLQKNNQFLDLPIASAMTSPCTTVCGDQLAGEVLDLLRQCRIGEAPVIDKNNRLLGLADLKSLLNLST